MTRAVLFLLIVATGVQTHAADQSWIAAEARTVRVLSNASPASTTRALGEVEAAEAIFLNLVGAAASKPIRVFAVKDAESLRELAPQFWERRGIRPHSVAYAGPYTAFMAVRDDLDQTVRHEALMHEYVHLLTASLAPDAPAWLDEGLSEFWGTVVVEGDRVIVGRSVKRHIARLQQWQQLERTVRLQRGEFIADSEPASMFYAQSWAMVHYLLLGRTRTTPLTFLPDYRALPVDFESGLREYVSKGQLREVSLPFTPHISSAPTPSFVPEARSLAERAHMLVFGPRPDAAVALAKRALALEPRDSVALEVMGTYFFLHNKPEEARTWLTRAFDTRSASPSTAVYLALLTPSVADRERYLSAAVAAQPELEIAWQRLFEIYRDDGRLNSLRGWCNRSRWKTLIGLTLVTVPVCG